MLVFAIVSKPSLVLHCLMSSGHQTICPQS